MERPRRLLSVTVLAICLAGPALSQARLELGSAPEGLRDRLTAASLLLRDEGAGAPPAPQDVVAAARADYGRLVAVLYEFGFFAPVVSITLDGREAARISPFAAPARIGETVIRVDPGTAFRLGAARIGPLAPGDGPPPGFAPGAAASTPILRQAAESGIAGWRQAGHATARVAGQSLVARNAEARLDAEITLDPGPRLRFGALVPSGQARMRPDRLRAIAGLPTGAVFDPDALDRTEGRLRRTGVFRSVALVEQPPNPDGTLDIAARLDEAPLRRIGFGAELGSVEGLTLSAYWLHRNLFGGAERLRFDAGITGLGQDGGNPDAELSVRLSRPATFSADTTLMLGAALGYVDDPTFQELAFDLSTGVEHLFSDSVTGTLALGLGYVEISDGFGDRQVTLVTLPAGLTRDTRDNPLDARSGYYAAVELMPFLAAGTGEPGARATLDLRGYRALGDAGAQRVAGRLQLGTLEGGSLLSLPPDTLFFSGGGGTVRGQDYRSLGALQAGQPGGGRGFAGLSAEYRADLSDRFGLVGFADAGYVSAGPLGDGSGDWHAGAGLGLRYDTPLGPIRVDLATPVTGDRAGRRLLLYIGIGQAF